MITINTFNSIVVCGKEKFSQGEKKKFSGIFKRWVKGEGYHKEVNYFFLYRQPIRYHIGYVSEKERFNKNLKQLKKYCLQNGLYSYPICGYNQRIIVARISFNTIIGKYRFHYISGDDAIFPEVFIEEENLEVFMKYFQKNHMSLDLANKLVRLNSNPSQTEEGCK